MCSSDLSDDANGLPDLVLLATGSEVHVALEAGQRLAEQGQNSIACSQGRYGVSPRVSFDVSRINFRGRAHTLTFQSSLGRLEQRGLFNDEVRRFFDKPNWIFTFTAFYDNSINVTTFTSERLEASLQFQQTYSRVSQFLYRFTYRRVKASNVVVSPDQIPVYSAPVRVGIPSITYIRDKRDNVIDTHNGNYTTVDAAWRRGTSGRRPASDACWCRTRPIIPSSGRHLPDKRRCGCSPGTRGSGWRSHLRIR